MAVEPIFESYGNKLIGVPNNEESGGSGGHVIENSSGTDLPQEDTLQFADSHVTDDSTNGKTVVETFKAVTQSEYSSETEDGAYIITDGDGATIYPASEDYVEVTADGEKTYGALLNELSALVDRDKVQLNSILSFHNTYYRLALNDNGTLYYSNTYCVNAKANQKTVKLSNSSWWISWEFDTNGNTKPQSPSTSDIATKDTVFRLYYGQRKAVVDLQTTANRCLMPDGQTVVSNWFKTVTLAYEKEIASQSSDMKEITSVIPSGYKPITCYAEVSGTSGLVVSIGNPLRSQSTKWYVGIVNPYSSSLTYRFNLQIVCIKA